MSTQLVREGPHRCDLPNPTFGELGDIVACCDCGRWWRNARGGYAHNRHWQRASIRQWLARRDY